MYVPISSIKRLPESRALDAGLAQPLVCTEDMCRTVDTESMRTTDLTVSLGVCTYFFGGVGGHPRPENLADQSETLNNTTYGSPLFELFCLGLHL